MNDTRLNGAGGTPPVVTPPVPGGAGGASKFKSAAPVAAGALAIVAALVGGTMLTQQEEEAPIAASVAPETPAPTATPDMQPPQPGSSVPGVANQTPGAATAAAGVEIVVKFKDDAKVKDIIDAFWKDQASARTKFEAFKAGKPAFAGLKLDRVTYSNELVLVDASGGAPAARIPAMREIAAKLKNNADISYADPNMTAHPGGQ